MNPDADYQTRCHLLLEEASRWIGITEKGGDNKGSEVEQFQKAVDGKAQSEAWCAAFVQFCINRTDQRYNELYGGPSQSSWLFKTEHVLTLWNKSPLEARLKEKPHPGCLIVWQYWKDGVATTSGHVGIIAKLIDDVTVETIEGNTGPSDATVEREGDGVYRKTRRLISKNSSMRVKGFLTCWNSIIENKIA